MQDNNLEILFDLENPDVKPVIRWAVSCVKKVETNFKEPLPEYIVDLLSNNQSKFIYSQIYRMQMIALSRFKRISST